MKAVLQLRFQQQCTKQGGLTSYLRYHVEFLLLVSSFMILCSLKILFSTAQAS